jgi:hypothetical protein
LTQTTGGVATSAAAEYFERLSEAFETAAAVGRAEQDIAVAGRRVRLRAAGAGLCDALYPAISHLAVAGAADPEFVFCLWDGASSGVSAPEVPWGAGAVTPRGGVRGFNDDGFRTLIDPDSGMLMAFSQVAARLVCWTPDARAIGWHERSSPLRAPFAWALARPSMPLVHAGAVGCAGNAVLLAGPSGSGKSVTALACAAAGLDYLGDDYLLVETGGEAAAHSLYCMARVHERDLACVAGATDAIAGRVQGGPGPKAVVDVRRLPGARLADRQRVRGLLVLRPVSARDAAARVRAIPPAEALRSLAPSTLFQLPAQEPRSVLAALGVLARQLPTYALDLTGDPRRAAREVASLCDRL